MYIKLFSCILFPVCLYKLNKQYHFRMFYEVVLHLVACVTVQNYTLHFDLIHHKTINRSTCNTVNHPSNFMCVEDFWKKKQKKHQQQNTVE